MPPPQVFMGGNMKLKEAIDRVDRMKPNAFSCEQKTDWINEIEGKLQTEVFLFAPPQIVSYSWDMDQDSELLAAPPHDRLYCSYLMAMVDFFNGEYNRYKNSSEFFNSQYREFMRWFAARYRPADRRELYL